MENNSKMEKNAEIIRKRFDEFADELLDYGLNKMSPTNATFGFKWDPADWVLRLGLKPLVKVSRQLKRARNEIKKQTDVVIKFSFYVKKNSEEGIQIDSLPPYKDFYNEFLENDTLYRFLEKGNKKIENEFLSIKEEHFKTLVGSLVKILDGEGESYYDLVKSVCKERKEAEELLNCQFQFLDKYRKFNPYYKLPAKNEALRLLKEGEIEAKKVLKEELDKTY